MSSPLQPILEGRSIFIGEWMMASGKDSKGNSISGTKPKTPRFNNTVFISFPLSEEQKREVKNAAWDLGELDNTLSRLCEENYKVTFSYDDYSSAYACFITPKGDKHSNFGYILTGRGSSPHKALKQAYYVHAVLFEGDWSGWKDERRNTDLDD